MLGYPLGWNPLTQHALIPIMGSQLRRIAMTATLVSRVYQLAAIVTFAFLTAIVLGMF